MVSGVESILLSLAQTLWMNAKQIMSLGTGHWATFWMLQLNPKESCSSRDHLCTPSVYPWLLTSLHMCVKGLLSWWREHIEAAVGEPSGERNLTKQPLELRENSLCTLCESGVISFGCWFGGSHYSLSWSSQYLTAERAKTSYIQIGGFIVLLFHIARFFQKVPCYFYRWAIISPIVCRSLKL